MNYKYALLLCFAQAVFGADAGILGFPPGDLAQERKWEQQAKALPDSTRISTYLKHMSLKPHLAGTPASKAVAEYAVGLEKEWGLDAHLEQFEALLPTPKARILEMVTPHLFRAKLVEPPVQEDPTSFDKDEVPTYNAYSGSGDVTAPLVYANHGMPADYEYLAKHGIDVKGKIVITRYGGGWRGLKPRLAQEHGAVGCIIYSDPKDDGYYRGDVYPKGMWRPADGVQRGSVMDMILYPGDPLSPGWASEPGSKRLKIEEATTLMKIPVLPISYGDALPLMQELGGPVAPADWRGALGLTYHIGSDAEKVHLKVEMDNSAHPLYDVIARIPGSEFPDEWVLAGNHHDAWVHGAMDPLSGTSALLETARSLGELYKQGWRPKRTILIALWDGEEFGLIGSTEYVEKHAAELSQKLVAYINSDSNGKGQLGAGGSHSLESFVLGIARDMNDPKTGKPLADDLRQRSSAVNASGAAREPVKAEDWHMQALGSGSDYTAFLQHLGIASLNFGFGDEDGSGGIYHSAYDSYYWYSHFGDPNFVYEKALSEVTELALLRFADAPLLPFQFKHFAQSVNRYVGEIQKLDKYDKRLDLGPLQSEVQELEKTSASFETAYAGALGRVDQTAGTQMASINERLYGIERHMLLDAGLPRRPWFRHGVYAPGSLTGYDVKTLPGIREAVEAGQLEEAREQARVVTEMLKNVDREIQATRDLLSGL
jgi:N-acetylated-alpha-linked acidic dipeptidase